MTENSDWRFVTAIRVEHLPANQSPTIPAPEQPPRRRRRSDAITLLNTRAMIVETQNRLAAVEACLRTGSSAAMFGRGGRARQSNFSRIQRPYVYRFSRLPCGSCSIIRSPTCSSCKSTDIPFSVIEIQPDLLGAQAQEGASGSRDQESFSTIKIESTSPRAQEEDSSSVITIQARASEARTERRAREPYTVFKLGSNSSDNRGNDRSVAMAVIAVPPINRAQRRLTASVRVENIDGSDIIIID